jgi:multidrug resistance efflux pump
MPESELPSGQANETSATEAAEADRKNNEPRDVAGVWTRRLLIVAAVIWIWHLFADRITPYSEHARVRTYITPVVPQVSGNVVEVGVDFSQVVKAGDLLFKIDQTHYQLALDKAQASLDQVLQNVGASGDDIVTSEAKLTQAQTYLNYAETEARRYQKLAERGVIAEAERARVAAVIERARSDVVKAEAELKAAERKLGDEGADNPRVREALSRLRSASLDLARTEIRAPADGAVTNAILSPGQYANKGRAVMTFLDTKLVWVEAYLRENSLGRIEPGAAVDIALDKAPGKVFAGEVANLTYGVNWNQAGQSASALPTISVNEGWLRDAQRFPVHIIFKDDLAEGHRLEGGQADVVIYTGNNYLLNAVAWLQIRLMSLLSYVY